MEKSRWSQEPKEHSKPKQARLEKKSVDETRRRATGSSSGLIQELGPIQESELIQKPPRAYLGEKPEVTPKFPPQEIPQEIPPLFTASHQITLSKPYRIRIYGFGNNDISNLRSDLKGMLDTYLKEMRFLQANIKRYEEYGSLNKIHTFSETFMHDWNEAVQETSEGNPVSNYECLHRRFFRFQEKMNGFKKYIQTYPETPPQYPGTPGPSNPNPY
jgi:hypothetical protein